MGDLTGDGLADGCARGGDGVHCWLSTGTGFAPPFDGPAWTDALGWDAPASFGTLRLADFDGDGRDDRCVRGPSGFGCFPSTGAGFGPEVPLGKMGDNDTWLAPAHHGTIRMADVTGDGRAEVCARQQDQVTCWPSQGTAWGEGLAGPAWSDDAGWDDLPHWSTIRTDDLDGDGRADLCGRGTTSWLCHLSTGAGFGPEIVGPALADDGVWDDDDNHATLRMGDIDGDGDADLCGRPNGSLRCHPVDGVGFGEPLLGPELRTEDDWNLFRTCSTLVLADVNGDGRDDVCGRGRDGAHCWLSDGASLATVNHWAGWDDAAGWSAEGQFGTLRIANPVPRPLPPDPDPTGTTSGDTGATETNGTTGPAGPVHSGDDPGGPSRRPAARGSGCGPGGPGRGGLAAPVALAALAARSRRRGADRAHRR